MCVCFNPSPSPPRLVWSCGRKLFLLRRASGGFHGHLHHLCLLEWRTGDGVMSMDDEAALPVDMGWEEIRQKKNKNKLKALICN